MLRDILNQLHKHYRLVMETQLHLLEITQQPLSTVFVALLTIVVQPAQAQIMWQVAVLGLGLALV